MSQEKLDQQIANELAQGALGTITLGGERYAVRQPTPADRTALGAEAVKTLARQREKKLREVFTAYAESPPHVLERALKAFGLDEAPAKEIGDVSSEKLTQAIMDPECAAFLAWLLVRKDHPSATLTEIRKHVTEENASEVAATLLIESGMVKLDPNSGGATGSQPAPTT